MSHISTGVEYALHCMLYLAEPPHGVREASVRDLAELQGVPAEYVGAPGCHPVRAARASSGFPLQVCQQRRHEPGRFSTGDAAVIECE